MARALRLLVAGGWNHVVARGNSRRPIFLADRDRERFLGLVAVRHGGLRLAEVLRSVPGRKYMAVLQGVKRFAARLQKDQEAQRFVRRLRKEMTCLATTPVSPCFLQAQ